MNNSLARNGGHVPEDQDKPQLHPDREQLFTNEAFAIGMSQAVAGGSIVASIAQIDAISEHAGILVFLVFMSLMSISLIAAVTAAYWRHQYKMWDVKQQSSKANSYLWSMRYAMVTSVILTISGILFLVVGFWVGVFGAG